MSCVLALSAHFIINNLVLILVGLFVLVFFILFPFAIFITSLVEKCRISEYQTVDPASQQEIPDRCIRARDEALGIGFHKIGNFIDGDKGVLKGNLLAMLSPDGTTLLLLMWSKLMSRFKIMSRVDGRWIITGDSAGIPDLSGVDAEEVLPNAKFHEALQHHMLRLARFGGACVELDSRTLTKELHSQNVRRVDRYESLRYAKRIYLNGELYRYTIKGAIRVTMNFFTNILKATRKT